MKNLQDPVRICSSTKGKSGRCPPDKASSLSLSLRLDALRKESTVERKRVIFSSSSVSDILWIELGVVVVAVTAATGRQLKPAPPINKLYVLHKIGPKQRGHSCCNTLHWKVQPRGRFQFNNRSLLRRLIRSMNHWLTQWRNEGRSHSSSPPD